MQIIIPDNLQLDDLIIKNHPEFYAHLDKLYFIVSYIFFKSYSDRRFKKLSDLSKRAKRKLFVPINAEYLQRICGANYYKNILSLLLSEEILETDNYYIPKQKSKAYRITERFLYNKGKSYTIKDKKMIKRIKEKEKEVFTDLSEVNKQIFEMIKSRFTFDLDSAFKVSTQQKKTKIINDKTFDYTYNQLIQLQNNNFYFSTSNKTNRVFHNYSNLKKDLRNFITHISGDRLIEIDIANSQPFFLGCIISQLEQKEDTMKFIEIVQNGKFYDYLRDNLSSDLRKEDILTMLYCPTYWNLKHKDRFTELFPTVSKIITQIKGTDYKNLAIQLQSREATMILRIIAPKLLDEKIDFIPIHDSFLVRENDLQIVKSIINKCFYDKYKIVPTLKIKDEKSA